MSAVIRPDLTVVISPPGAAAPGWAVRGLLTATFRTLTTVFRSPDFGIDATEDCTLWQLETPAGRAQLASQHTGTHFLSSPDSTTTWMVQASSFDVLPWIFQALPDGTASFPRSTQEVAVGTDRMDLIRAYRRFLRKRADAVAFRTAGSPQLPLSEEVALWRQLVSAHQALGRALYLAVTPQDVAAALRQLADRLEKTGCEPGSNAGLHGEFVATVRALAAAECDQQVPA
ncbi:hypothetical protein DL991_29165 [Amycolatopsis sp. WAC 01375]|uniref:hypothetical protein n=1 Tax=Amycolatopsis sp. WAC 01375 TaxID=2203194 RepID=UPI000F7AFAB5|nr:hypothetical protein [Amycolatopsis sp. WAC 01375]RSM74728.1 hypothetical protein DL991_29165 [Amycolatopsis sp. WAC 01375]